MAKTQSYEERCSHPFEPTAITYSQLKSTVPTRLRERNTAWALFYVGRDILLSGIFFYVASHIDESALFSHIPRLRWIAWAMYWFSQSLVWTGMWALAHDSCHGNISDSYLVNNIVGYTFHTFLLVPFFAFRATHLQHHRYTNSVERDEMFVPVTREHLGLPKEEVAKAIDYEEILGEAPLVTLLRLIAMQLFGLQSYLAFNTLGAEIYPSGTNHYSPSSPLFKPKDRFLVVLSDIGLLAMLVLFCWWTYTTGFTHLAKLYLIPWMMLNHWIVMIVFMQHSDPTVPHYRAGEWNWLRGALATVDRPLLGWAGRFFLHNIAHDHVAHHLFPDVPFYNQPGVTEAIKPVLKDDYCFDSTNTFVALYRCFDRCVFVENEGSILFYKDKEGKQARQVRELSSSTRAVSEDSASDL